MYGTNHELRFISGLGYHRPREFRVDTSRIHLLKQYIASCENRERWGDIDKDAVVQFAELCLAQEGR